MYADGMPPALTGALTVSSPQDPQQQAAGTWMTTLQ